MSFRPLSTECFIFSGISDGKGLATMVWFEKNFPRWNLQPSFLYLQHALECLWSWYNFTSSGKSVFSFLFGKYAWTILSTKVMYSSTLFSFNTLVHSKSRWNSVYEVNDIVFSFTWGPVHNNLSEKTFHSILKVSCY